ncbi:hypothetical protein [Streptomyces sp. 3N207]|uniref:hypothetical protein n=1 Tax=Streptomyces sp. 3N207 TaxID=3457417 RepID=UPI003FCFC1C3
MTFPVPGYARMDPDRYDRALAELALPGTIDESGQAQPAVADPAPEGRRRWC